MERIQQKLDNWQDRLDSRWRQLPRLRRRRIILYSFACYLLITLAILFQVLCQLGKGQDRMDMQHIHNTVAREITESNTANESKNFNREHNERK